MPAQVVALPGGGGADVAEPIWADTLTDAGDIDYARELWRLVVAEMRNAGTLAPANGPQIARYVSACILYRRAEIAVHRDGPVTPRKKGQPPAWNLWFSVLRDAAGMAGDLEAELGLSPRRRAGATAAKKRATKTNAAESYLAAARKG